MICKGWLVVLYGISSLIGYLIPNPVYTHTHTHTHIYINKTLNKFLPLLIFKLHYHFHIYIYFCHRRLHHSLKRPPCHFAVS